MFDTLVKFVFYIITSVYSLLFSPFIDLIFALFPDLSSLYIHVTEFLAIILTYFSSCIELLLIPRSVLLLLFNYFLIKYSIYLIKLTIKLGIKIYRIFKP